MSDAPIPDAVTLPFFIEQVGFHQADITKQAKYLLFFITRVIRLRRDGIGLARIADAINSLTGRTPTDDDLHRIKEFFANDPDIYLARRDGAEVYAILDTRVQFLFAELNRHLRVFISYTRSFQDTAERIRNVLIHIGVAAWLDIHEPGRGTIMESIQKAIDDSCLVVFLITPEFKYEAMTKHVIDRTLFHYLSRNRERFAIMPIVLLKPDETPSPTLIEERVPQPLRHANLACHWAKDDAEIIEHIVDAMPVRLGIIDWKRPPTLNAESTLTVPLDLSQTQETTLPSLLAAEQRVTQRWKWLARYDKWAIASTILSIGSILYVLYLLISNSSLLRLLSSAVAPAFASIHDLPPNKNEVKLLVVVLMIIFVCVFGVWCMITLSFSSRPAAISTAKEGIKMVGGFFVGAITGFIG